MEKFVSLKVDVVELVPATLRQDEMTRSAIGSADRCPAIGCRVISIVATKTAVPILMANEVGM